MNTNKQEYTYSISVRKTGETIRENMTYEEAKKMQIMLGKMDKANNEYDHHKYKITKYPVITEQMARNFYADVRGSFGLTGEGTSASVSHKAIAEKLEVSLEFAEIYIYACYRYGITEKQGGGMVI